MSYLAAPASESVYTSVPLEANAPVDGRRFVDVPLSRLVDYPSPQLEPLEYPGRHPEHGFSTYGEDVLPIRAIETADGVSWAVNMPEGIFNLNDWLTVQGAETMENRFPIVSFGSNACPGQLTQKVSVESDKKNHITTDVDRSIIPTLTGRMHNVASAYSSKIGIRGYVFAELIEAPGVDSKAFVNFLTAGQLGRIVHSEGAYELCDMGQVYIDGLAEPITAYGFAGKNPVLLDEQGKPVLLKSFTEHKDGYRAMTEEEVLDELAREFGTQLDEAYPRSPFFARDARSLMAYASYRMEFLRRKSTETVAFKHSPKEGQEPDERIGVTLQNILMAAGRVSSDKLLDHLPPERRNVSPQTFATMYTAKKDRTA